MHTQVELGRARTSAGSRHPYARWHKSLPNSKGLAGCLFRMTSLQHTLAGGQTTEGHACHSRLFAEWEQVVVVVLVGNKW